MAKRSKSGKKPLMEAILPPAGLPPAVMTHYLLQAAKGDEKVLGVLENRLRLGIFIQRIVNAGGKLTVEGGKVTFELLPSLRKKTKGKKGGRK